MQNTLVCIVNGAGQAGLATSYHLHHRKFNYEVLEGSDKVYKNSISSTVKGLRFVGLSGHALFLLQHCVE